MRLASVTLTEAPADVGLPLAAAGETARAPESLLDEIRARLVDKLWWGLLLISIIGVPLSVSRSLGTGWLPMYTAHLSLGLLVVTAFATRKRLPYPLRVGLIIGLFWAVGVIGAMSMGLLGAGLWWLSVSTLLVCVLVSMRWGILSVAAVTLVLILIGAGFVTGALELGFDANDYLRRPTSWAVLLIGTTLMPVIVFYTISQFLDATQALLHQVHAQSLEINTQKAELAQANTALRDFASIVGHDLVEPIRGINTMAMVLLEDHAQALDNEGRGHLRLIESNSSRLSTMVRDLLQVSRLDHGGICREEVDTQQIIQDIADTLSELIREKRTQLRIRGPLPRVNADRVRLREVFYNLIVNAMKYNDKDQPWVEIGARQKPDAVEFYVADNGIGIQPGHEETIFRMFQRDHTPGQFGEGSGVGLSLVQKIIQMHGGQIHVGHSAEGGAEFSFTLPLQAEPARPDTPD